MKRDFGTYLRDLPGKPMHRSIKFCQKVFSFKFFLVDKGREDTNTSISGPSSARQRNTIKMAFLWRANDGPPLNAGLVAL